MSVSAPFGGWWGQQFAGVEQDGQMSLVFFSFDFALVGGITFTENWLKTCERSAVDGVAGYPMCPIFFFFFPMNRTKVQYTLSSLDLSDKASMQLC